MEWLPPVTEARRRRSPRTDGFPQRLCVGKGGPHLVARKASPSTCSKGAGLGAQADARVPKVTLYPGVAPHWTGNLECRQMCWRCVPPELEMDVWRGEMVRM